MQRLMLWLILTVINWEQYMSDHNYTTTNFSNTDLQQFIGTPGHRELWMKATQMMARKETNRYDVYTALSQVVEGDQLLRTMLRSETTRREFQGVIGSYEGLTDVIYSIFGRANVHYNTPKYASQDVLASVNRAADYKTTSSRTQVLIAAVLNDMLDVFKMRTISSEVSWVYENSSAISPTLDEIVNELLEVTAADKISHHLKKFHERVAKSIPNKQFDISSYIHVMHETLRNIAITLDSLGYKEVWVRDVFHLLGGYIVGEHSQLNTYGDLRGNAGLQALALNSTLCRLAVHEYDKGRICSIPAHELNDEVQFITRNISNLSSFEVITDTTRLVQMQSYNRSTTGSLLSVLISGVRQFLPDVNAYFVAEHKALGLDNVDVENRTARLKAYIPSLGKGIISDLAKQNIDIHEEELFNSKRNNYRQMVVGVSDVSDELMHDVVSVHCEVQYTKIDGKVTVYYIFNDSDKRLGALSASTFSNMTLTSAQLAMAGCYPTTEGLQVENFFLTESIGTTGKFSGVWPQRNTKTLSSMKIKINDLLNDKSNKNFVAGFEIDVFENSPVLTRSIELQLNAGWSNVTRLINHMADELNKPGAQRPQMQRNRWIMNMISLLGDWINKDVAIHSLVNRAHDKFSAEAQKANLSEEYIRVSTYYTGMIALQVAVETINVLGANGIDPEGLNDNSLKLLYSTEALTAIGHLVQ